MRRGWIIVGVIAALGGAAAYWVAGTEGRAVANQPAWRTAKVERGAIIAAVNSTGTINPLSTVVVGSQVSGQVLEILADFNAEVKAGQVLARLDPTQIRARLDGARADLANMRALRQVQDAQIEQGRSEVRRAAASRTDAVARLAQVEAQLGEAERVLGRQRELGSRGVVANAAIDTARSSVDSTRAQRDSARAQIASAEAAQASTAANLKVLEAQAGAIDAQILQREAVVRQIEVDLANTEIRSPVDGTVVQRQVELGQTVAASLQAPTLFLVAQDLRSMEIYANIDEADVGRVRPGQTVTFSVNAFPNRTFEGQVKLIRLGSQTIQNVVIYTAVIAFSNPRMELLPGMTATVRVITERRDETLKVPNAALRFRPQGEAPAHQQSSAPAASPFGPPAGMGGPGMGGAGMGGRGPGGGAGGGQGAGGQQMREFVDAVRTELRLDPAQRERIDGILRDSRQRFMALADPSLDRAQRVERARQIRDEIAGQMEAALTPEQRTAFAEIRARFSAERGAATQPGRVFVVDSDGKPKAVPLRLGVSDGAFTEVVSGELDAGREVIVGGGPSGAPAASRGFRMF